ncbi:DMT family transporter [Pedobacter immunditicola]|uniref:DMT family transporter n=1 Tax=Pedobacter immunditicola TaxID=3133440 RepID=UPI0030AC1FF8
MLNAKLDFKLLFALMGVAIIWGTTYLGIRIAVETIPPWFVTAIRQSIASLILLAVLVSRGELKYLGWPHLRRQIILSFLMIVISNGLTTVAEQTIPSGLTSLLISLVPLVVFLGSVVFKLQKPSFKGFAGVLLGFLGVAFLFRQGLGDLLDPDYKTGIMFLSLAILGWATGTIYIKKNVQQTENIFLDLFYQFVFSAVIQWLFAFLFSSDTAVDSWSLNSFLAIVYLGVFGSVVGFFCFHYALKKVSAVKTSILSYFNTIIAIFLGWLILDEVITKDIIIATVLIISGIVITNYTKKEKIS